MTDPIDTQRDELNEVHARLAAVVELAKEQVEDYANEVGTDNYYHGQYDLAVDILDLARSEGGEQASAAQGDNLTSPAISQPGEPAAPDATLDEIVRECMNSVFDPHYLSTGVWNMTEAAIRAACVRARETDEGYGQLKEGYMSLRERIDRALERLENITDCYYAKQIEDILTDLEEEAAMAERARQRAKFEKVENTAQARLGDVAEWLQTSLDCAIVTGGGMEKEEIVDLLALARGEGGGSGRASSTSVSRPAEQSASDARVPDPAAAPDATLDEIVQKILADIPQEMLTRFQADQIIRAACIRARKTERERWDKEHDWILSLNKTLNERHLALAAKLAAVVEALGAMLVTLPEHSDLEDALTACIALAGGEGGEQ